MRESYTAAAVDGVVYLFGGSGCGTHFNDLYALDVADAVWRLVKPANAVRPAGRTLHACAVVDNSFFVHGGEGVFDGSPDAPGDDDPDSPHKRGAILAAGSGFRRVFSDMFQFDTRSLTWHPVSTTDDSQGPGLVRAHSLLMHSYDAVPVLVSFGGTGPVMGGDAPSNAVWLFKVETSEWVAVTPRGAPPAPRSSHAACIVGDCMYIHGGVGAHDLLGDLWRLHLGGAPEDDFVWEEVVVGGDAAPGCVYGHTIVNHPWLPDQFFMFGGRNYESTSTPCRLWGFDATTDAWCTPPADGAPPSPRFGHCFVPLYATPSQAALDDARYVLRRLGPGSTRASPGGSRQSWRRVLGLDVLDSPSPKSVEEASESEGWFDVLPAGYGGPFSQPPLSLQVHAGKVFDPTPAQQLAVRAHAVYKRAVLIGGVKYAVGSPGTQIGFCNMAHSYQLCVSPPRGSEAAVPLLRELAATRDAEADARLVEPDSLTFAEDRAKRALAAMPPPPRPVHRRKSAPQHTSHASPMSYDSFKRMASGKPLVNVMGMATVSASSSPSEADYYARFIEKEREADMTFETASDGGLISVSGFGKGVAKKRLMKGGQRHWGSAKPQSLVSSPLTQGGRRIMRPEATATRRRSALAATSARPAAAVYDTWRDCDIRPAMGDVGVHRPFDLWQTSLRGGNDPVPALAQPPPAGPPAATPLDATRDAYGGRRQAPKPGRYDVGGGPLPRASMRTVKPPKRSPVARQSHPR